MMKKQITVLTGAAMLMMAALSGCSAGAANGNAAPATTAAATEAVKQETEAEKPAESKAESGAVEAATDWPKENITLWVPGKAGGATDTAARIVGDYLEKALDATVVIQNEPTGSGAVLLESIRTTDNPDYNIALVGSQPITLHQGGQYEYNVLDPEQFSIVSHVIDGAHSNCLATSKDAPFQTYDEFVEYAKANPGKTRMMMSAGNLSEVYSTIIKNANDLDVKFLQAESGDQVVNLLGGMGDCFISSYSTLQSYEGTGDLVPLLFISTEREEAYPDVPCFADVNLSNQIATVGQNVIASAKMDPAVIAKINEVLPAIEKDADSVDRAATTNNKLVVLNQEDSIANYQQGYDVYLSAKSE